MVKSASYSTSYPDGHSSSPCLRGPDDPCAHHLLHPAYRAGPCTACNRRVSDTTRLPRDAFHAPAPRPGARSGPGRGTHSLRAPGSWPSTPSTGRDLQTAQRGCQPVPGVAFRGIRSVNTAACGHCCSRGGARIRRVLSADCSPQCIAG